MKYLTGALLGLALSACAMVPALAQECETTRATLEQQVRDAQGRGMEISLHHYEGAVAQRAVQMIATRVELPENIDNILVAAMPNGTVNVAFMQGTCLVLIEHGVPQFLFDLVRGSVGGTLLSTPNEILRAMDEIGDIFREMNRQGGFAAVGR